ncbi:uncharacterized protein TNCV_3414901 [Trichonephila clavipes]|nr:uncharacterized protein TNCV_3414901 [Trichonephila clavipes]
MFRTVHENGDITDNSVPCRQLTFSAIWTRGRGLFSLRISPGLASKAIVGVFSFGENLELVFIHDTSVKEMHTAQAVSVFGVVSLLWGRTDLYVFSRGNVNDLTYRDDILEKHMRALMVAAVAEWYRYRTVACFVTGSSPVPLKTRRVGQRCTLNLSRAETSSRWCGVVVRRGGASSGVVHVT